MKALVFLRHYNDIDHITPIIDKWQQVGHACDVILLADTAAAQDYRIRHLATLEGVRVAHLRDIVPPRDFLRYRLLTRLATQAERKRGYAVAARALGYGPRRRLGFWRRLSMQLLDRTFAEGRDGVVAFDWVSRNTGVAMEWVRVLVEMTHDRGMRAISLPHGDSPHANKMIRDTELSPSADTTFANADIFDSVAVPNHLCAERFEPHMDNARIAVLGSPRYCDEWLARLPTLLPPSPLSGTHEGLHVVMFLRKRNFTSFWEEIAIVARMIAGFPGTALIIKEHTRSGWKQPLARDQHLRRLRQVRVVGDEVHSAHLLDWADVVIDIATSVSFEAVKREIPVLAADYLHAGLSTVARLIPETLMQCRDDVWHAIDGFVRNGTGGFYDEGHRRRFIDEIIDVPDAEVLPRYVALLAGSHATTKGATS
jgi:hypothetical protein